MGIRWDGTERRRSGDRRRRDRFMIVVEAMIILFAIWLLVVAASVDFAGPGGVR